MKTMNHKKGECECIMCAAMKSGLSEPEARAKVKSDFTKLIETHDIAVVGVSIGNTPLVYTVGLTDMGFPEVVVMGMNHVMATNALNIYCAEVKKGETTPGLGILDKYFTLPLYVNPVDAAIGAEIAVMCEEFYRESGKKPTYVQWVMCDKVGVFPWEENYDYEYMESRQFLMGMPPEV